MFKTPAQEKVVPHHKPADYIPKILHEPFKLENPSTWVSSLFADFVFQSESSLWFIK